MLHYDSFEFEFLLGPKVNILTPSYQLAMLQCNYSR